MTSWADAGVTGVVALALANHQDAVGLARSGSHFGGFRQRAGQGLFDENVMSGAQRREGRGWCGNIPPPIALAI